jgi:glyoxylase-like metal-dependent hydrolase (beta-lactamase superfamily II)
MACCYLVRTCSGIVLIDAGMSTDAEYIFAVCERAFGKGANIVAVLLTHWHNDHSAGAADVAVRSKAPVFFNEREFSYFSGKTKRGKTVSFLADTIPEFGPFVLLKGLLGNSVPRSVEPTEFVRDGDELLGEFTVIETPGHTDGDTSYFHCPTGALFAGDAIAIIGERIRLMSRFVTPDKIRARESVFKCLDREMKLICPGHRYPLSTGVDQERTRFLERLRSRDSWPLFG